MLLVGDPGSTHNGSLERCYDLIGIGADAGLDAVKFQCIPQGPEQGNAPCPFWRVSDLADLVAAGESRGVKVFASVFDEAGLALLMAASVPWVKFAYSMRDSVLIAEAVDVFDRVFVSGSIMSPGYQHPKVERLYVETVHGEPCYPVTWQLAPWYAIRNRDFVGLSDHSLTPWNADQAITGGAEIIEVHYRGDWECPYPDARFAQTPGELKLYILEVS